MSNARTPMPWDGTKPHAGFSTGSPWLALNPNWPTVNAAQALADPHSVFHHYRKLIALRQQHPVLSEGRTTLLLPDDPQVYAVLRTLDDGDATGTAPVRWLVVCNFSASPALFAWPAHLPASRGTLVLGNHPNRPGWADGQASEAASHLPLTALELAPWEALIVALAPA